MFGCVVRSHSQVIWRAGRPKTSSRYDLTPESGNWIARVRAAGRDISRASRWRVEGVGHLLGGQTPHGETRVMDVLHVGFVARNLDRAELIGSRIHDRPQQMLEVVLVLEEVSGQSVEQLRVARGVRRPHVVERLDQTAALKYPQKRLTRFFAKNGLSAAVIQSASLTRRSIGSVISAPSSGRDLTTPPFARMRLLAGRFQVDTFSRPKMPNSWLFLRAEANEKRGHAVIIVLAPLFERVMMAFGTADAHSEEELRGRLGPVGGVVGGHEEIRGPSV